jgi:3-hydroxybutyryl-CoA dehydrogenase
MNIERVGVIGAGQMGSGVAHVLALAGYDVVLEDVDAGQLEKAVASIRKNMGRQAAKEVIKQDEVEPAMARIRSASSLEAMRDRDMVIEAATENETIKRAIFKELCPILAEKALIATNTSSISVTRLASATDRPERFIGLHFFNPVPMMKLVEVIRGISTVDATYQATLDLVKRIGKTAGEAADFPGFIVNRIFLPMVNEAIYALHEGVGSIEAIDTCMRLGVNHPMGPLQLADFIGLDTCLSAMQVICDGLGDSKYRPCPLLIKYVEAGWLGRKTGRGFYDYRGDKPVPTR